MLRATGFGKPLPVPWARWRSRGGPRTGFGTRPVRVAAGIVVAALVLGNAVLVSRLMGEGADSPVTRGAGDAVREDAGRSSFKALRNALQSVQASIDADVKALAIKAERDRPDRNDKPRETSTSGSTPGTASTGSSSGSNSTGSTSGGSSSTGSDSTDSGSGGSSGGSSGGDSGSDDTGGGGPGGGGGSDGGGGDSGGGGSSGGGGGGG